MGNGKWVNLREYFGSEKNSLKGPAALCSDPFLSEVEDAWRGAAVCAGVPGGSARRVSEPSPGATSAGLLLASQPLLEPDERDWVQGLGGATRGAAPGAGGRESPTHTAG